MGYERALAAIGDGNMTRSDGPCETSSLLERGERVTEKDAAGSSESGWAPGMRRRPLMTAAALLALLGVVFLAAVGPIGPWGETRGLSPDVTQPYLGLPGCKSAFTVPAEGPSDKYSPTFEKLVSMAEQVYVLCVDCGEVSVPSSWRDKVLLVDGKRIDDCVKDHHMDHWHRATFSHAIAVSHARARGFGNVAVVEDDARSDFTVVFSDADYEDFATLLKQPARGNFIRLGWRPYALETAIGDGCPRQCRCEEVVGARTCAIAGSGCDLRSSDAYLVARGAYNSYIHRLQLGVVDFDVLQSFDKMVLVNPMVSYQEKLDITMDSQRDLQAAFRHKCVGVGPSSALPVLDGIRGELAPASRGLDDGERRDIDVLDADGILF